MKNKVDYPQFINNAPCKDDLFAGKSHTTIAKNICNTIKNRVNCKMIGLDGSWGSGKSNLLKLVEKEINKEDIKYHFFLYDAWGHQEDIQRRAILEDLTEFLIKKENILDKKEWEEKHKKLLSKNKITEVKTVPKLSIGVIISALTVMLLPAFEPIEGLIKNYFNKASFVIYLFPLIIFLLFLIYYWYKKKNIKLAFQEIMSFYHKDRKDTTTEEFVSESVPSAREFNKWIGDISQDIKQYKLIIIFDNMDRLPVDKVQELWSSIHTFFSEQTYKNIWVIVPFDRLHIKNAFKSEDILNYNPNSNNISYGNDFINKTFDIVYRVSPPMLSDWKSYFKELWQQSMGISIEDENYQNVTQIYDLLTKEQSPRKIIAFINEFATIKQVSANSIPDPYIALYIFGKDIITQKGDSEFYSPSFLGAIDFLYKKDNEFPKYMASLHYQLPPEKVKDVIFVERLKQAFDNKEIENAKNMCQSSDFVNVLESAIPLVTNIPNTIEVLDEIFKKDIFSSKVKEYLWNLIYHKLGKKDEDKLEEYQVILLQNILEKDVYLKSILSHLKNNQNFDSKQYFEDINSLGEIKEINVFKHIEKKTVEPGKFIEFIKLTQKDIEKYKITCENTKLNDLLCSKAVEELKIDYIPYIPDSYKLDNFIAHIEELTKENTGDINNLEILYTRLKELDIHIAPDLLTDDEISSLFRDNPKHNFRYDLLCMRIARFEKFYSSYQNYCDNVLNNINIMKEYLNEVIKRIAFYTNYEDILLNLPKMDFPLYKAIAKELTKNQHLNQKFNILSILKIFDKIIDNSDIEPESLIEKLNQSKYDTITTDNISSLPIIFFESIKESNNKLATHCKEILEKYLIELPKEEWIEDITNNEFSYKSLCLMGIKLPDTAFEGLKDIMLQVAKGELNSVPINDQVIYLSQKAEEEKRGLKNIAKNIRDVFVRGDVEITSELFSMFGELLLKHGNLEDKKDSLRTILPNTIIFDNIRILTSQIEKIKLIINKAEDNAEDFKQFFSTERQNNKDIEQLGVDLGILSSSKEEKNNTP